jgi:dipeptidyl aminopeptidase/acylaminoacyl peptidase
MNRLLLSFALAFSLNALVAQNIIVDKWLVSPAISVHMPAFYSTQNVKGEKFSEKDLLKMPIVNVENQVPEKGKALAEKLGLWEEFSIAADSTLTFDANGNGYRVQLLATYLDVDNFWKGSLSIKSQAAFETYLNGKKISDRYSWSSSPKLVDKDVKFIAGKQKLVVKILIPDTLTGNLGFKAFLKPSYPDSTNLVSVSTNPTERVALSHILEGPKMGSVSISPTGDLVLISQTEMDTKKESNSVVRKIVRIADGATLAQYYGSGMSQIKWMPRGNKISYIANGNLWVRDFDKNTESILLQKLPDIASFQWEKGERFIIYTITEEDEPTKSDLKRIVSMEDRQSGWRNRSFLYMANIATGMHERLTWGNRSTWLHDISPDGSQILFGISNEHYKERPYRKHSLVRLNLSTRKLDTLWVDKLFGTSVSYSPNGKQLLVTGAPLAFGELGVNVKDNKITNGYDTQAYIYSLESGKVDPITLKFNPSISDSWWCPLTGNIYFNTVDEDKRSVYRYDVKKKLFDKLKLNEEVVGQIQFAEGKTVAVYTGSSSNSWSKAWWVDLKTMKSTLLDNPSEKTFANVKLSETGDWSFVSAQGQKVTGRYYLPPYFDPNKKYPMILYYYGGTTPVDRAFGGRYPKQQFAANGYVVLVLQPSGAIGFGQDFSAAHVNAWGERTADEIIEGTQKFFRQNSFVDSTKIGCIGASYGGFMTMYLVTRTNMFAAAISHAGISSISSYWGEGYWGYSYSAEASANSFPWNNRELYVDRSPLFSANKVTTPLLLLHGSVDTNVPVGESIQMYTALKLLGKQVELIQVDGENHHIQKYSRRVQWTNSIIAWFDKHLKERNDWWNDMYPAGNY